MPVKFDLAAYKNPVFIETGTCNGVSVRRAMRAGFARVYSIEIDDALFEQACARFQEDIASGAVVLLHGDSARLLPELVQSVDERCTFWLDAHSQNFNFENDTVGEENCPLYRELDAIATSSRNDHTILIDDLRLIKNAKAWRGHGVTLDGVVERLRSMNKDYVMQFEDGHIENDVLAAFLP